MSRGLFVLASMLVWLSATAEDSVSLSLTSADLERLGVSLQSPQPVDEIEIASGPAEIVIPPAQEAIVSSIVGGVLSRVWVAEGDFVSTGQPLAEITSAALLELQRAYVEAALTATLAREQQERDEGLHVDGIVSERRLRESRASARAATTAVNQLRQQLMLAGMTDGQLSDLVESGELGSTLTLRAPFDGVVIDQLASLGAHVDSLEPVHRVADLSKLWLEIHVPQERADRIRPGMRVLAVAERDLDAQVIHVGQVVDTASQTVLVRGSIDNESFELRAGQFLTARVLAAGDSEGLAIVVPTAAIVRDGSGAFIFGSDGDSVTVWPVEILAEDGTNTYVQGRFEADFSVAVAGVAALKAVWMSMLDGGE